VNVLFYKYLITTSLLIITSKLLGLPETLSLHLVGQSAGRSELSGAKTGDDKLQDEDGIGTNYEH